MDTARIAALLAPFLEQPLPLSALHQISTYIDLLLRWNARINLTAIRQPEQIVTRHFGESLFMARHLFPQPARAASRSHLLDLGSGAGFPGVPLKIWAPQIQLTLIESNHKKSAFLREVARALTLMDINVITGRAEALAARPDCPHADVVTLRAVESFKDILPHALALLKHEGTLALLVGADQVPHLTTLTHLRWHPPIAVPQSAKRVLSIGILQ